MNINRQELFTDNTDLLTSKQWEGFYPRPSYKTRTAFALHFLIALGEPLNTITSYVDTIKLKNPIKLTQADPQNHQLTPLHIAAMKGQLAVANILLETWPTDSEKELMINRPDAFGWTPLHHAAVTSASLFQRFLELGGDRTKQTKKGADCDDLLRLTNRVSDIRSSNTLFVKDTETNELILLSTMTDLAKEKIFGKDFIFTDSPLFSKERFHELWMNDEKNDWGRFEKSISELYHQFETTPVPLFIDHCEELRNVTPHILDCKAKDKILRGTVITEYSGVREDLPIYRSFADVLSENNIFATDYHLDNINARKKGNESRFCNTGFPNAFFISPIVRGVKRHLLLATRDIQPGESILWDYGIGKYNQSFGQSKLLAKEEMISFFQTYKDSLFNLVAKALTHYLEDMTLNHIINLRCFEDPIYYVLDSPTALLYLHFSETVHYSVWKNELENGSNTTCQTWKQKFSFERSLVMCIFEILAKLEKFYHNDEIKKAVHQWILSKLEKESIIHIMKGLDLLRVKSGVNSIDKLAPILVEIDQFLINYDWKNDLKKFPFNIERRVNLLLAECKTFSKKEVKAGLEKQLQLLDKNTEGYQINDLMLKRL